MDPKDQVEVMSLGQGVAHVQLVLFMIKKKKKAQYMQLTEYNTNASIRQKNQKTYPLYKTK